MEAGKKRLSGDILREANTTEVSNLKVENSALTEFVQYYNHKRYHEALQNVTPAEVYYGTAQRKINQRKRTKMKTLNARKKHYQFLN